MRAVLERSHVSITHLLPSTLKTIPVLHVNIASDKVRLDWPDTVWTNVF